MAYGNAPGLGRVVRQPDGTPIPTKMLLPFVRWLYGTPSPDTPPYGLLPNMSESSGTPGDNGPGFSRTFTYRRGVSLHCAKLHTCNHGLLQFGVQYTLPPPAPFLGQPGAGRE